jgi:hypothetical protein
VHSFEDKSLGIERMKPEGRKVWANEEEKRWKEMQRSGGWVNRLTAEEGLNRGGTSTEGRLTAAEHDNIEEEKIWTLSFTLERFGIPATRTDVLQRELCRIVEVLEMLSTFSYGDEGVMFSVVCGEECWPRVEIATMRADNGEGHTVLEERTVTNFLRVWMAGERGLLGLGTAGWVHRFWPVSHAAVEARVKKMKRALILRKVGRELDGDEEEDDGPHGAEKSWAEQLCKEGEVERLVEDTTASKHPVMIDIQLKDDIAETSANTLNVDNELSYAIPTPPPPAISRISTLSIPIPRLCTTLAPMRLLAYIELRAKIFLFADMYSEEDVLIFLRRVREDAEEALDERPVDTLGRVAQLVGLKERYVTALQLMVVEHDGEERSEARDVPFGDFLTHVERVYGAEKAYMTTFLERYEDAGGFLVPENRRVRAMAGETTRRRESQQQVRR